jgi:hypothetical protein
MDWRIPSSRAEVLRGKYAIERETAIKWAGRAIAAWRIYAERGRSERFINPNEGLKWRDTAISYAGEAIEHAAASGDNDLLDEVREAMRRVARELVD